MIFIKKLFLHTSIYLGIFSILLLLITNHYKNKYEKTKQELITLKTEYDLLYLRYKECNDNMNKIKVDYTKKLKAFIQKYNNNYHYDKLKELPQMRGNEDECKQIKELLNIYRNVEESGYFNNSSNHSMLTSNDKNQN